VPVLQKRIEDNPYNSALLVIGQRHGRKTSILFSMKNRRACSTASSAFCHAPAQHDPSESRRPAAPWEYVNFVD
jgi:hypothetical protein